MKTLILTLLTFNLSAHAFDKPANKLFKSFKACKQELKDRQLKSCISNYIDPELSTHNQRKLALWLKTHTIMSELRNCPAEKLNLFPYAQDKQLATVKCFKFKGSGRSKNAIIYFQGASQALKIKGIQFFR